MLITIATLGSRGDVQPFLSLAVALSRAEPRFGPPGHPAVEPLADPLRPGGEQSCLDPGAVTAAQARLQAALADATQSAQDLSVIQKQLEALSQLSGDAPVCPADLVELGNVVEDQNLLRASYLPSGVDMQFLVSTAMPDLILSQTACERLADRERCKCSGPDRKSVV